MKSIITFLFLFFSFCSFSQLPSEFPKNLTNKVFCGNTSVCGYVYGKKDCTFSTQFDYKVIISEEDGIYVEYNPEQKFGRDKLGKTDAIISFPLWTKEPLVQRDIYGDITGKTTTYSYKVYPNYKKDHYIKAVSLTIYEDGYVFFNGEIAKGYSTLNIEINVPNHDDAVLIIDSRSECGKLKTKLEVQKEEEEQKRIENEKKEEDILTIKKINELIEGNLIEEAAIEFDGLYFDYIDLKFTIQKKLDDLFTTKPIPTDSIDDQQLLQFVRNNKEKFKALSIGKHILKIEKDGSVTIDNSVDKIGELKLSKSLGVFKIPVKAQKTFLITSSIKTFVSEKTLSGTTRYVYKKTNNKFYKSKKKSGFYENFKFNYDSKVPGNCIRIVQPRTESHLIENIVISEVEIDPNVLKEYKLKKDYAKIISRTVGVTSIPTLIFFGGLRLYESSKIP